MNTPEIQELIRLVERKYGKCLNTTTDFEMFSLFLDKNGIGCVSPSTLKRMWGYVNDVRNPRVGTLDVLAMYIGHVSFDVFVDWLKTSPVYNSSFFTAYQIPSSELPVGTMLEIGWSPNRLVRLVYNGGSLYEVVGATNSKLKVGDSFIAGCFIKSLPLYLPYIIRDGSQTSPFIAGRNGGLTCINIIESGVI